MSEFTWIMTRRAGYNYGSVLQAYAMQQIILKLGFDNVIIDYDEYFKKVNWWIRPLIEDLFYEFMIFFLPFSKKSFPERYKYLKDRSHFRGKIDAFQERYLKITKKRYRTSRSLKNNVTICKNCVCGSDQIWSPLLFDEAMFLSFCHGTGVKTIAYAPSFGVSVIKQKKKKKIRKLIRKIDFVSVREKQGVKIIEELIGEKVPMVLDPTFLLSSEDWEKLVDKSIEHKKPYALCYFLGNVKSVKKKIDEFASKRSLSIINLMTYRSINDIGGEQVSTASPGEFLSYIMNSDCVFTDSFHAVVFSVLYGKDFFVFKRFADDEYSQNSRIISILDNLDLKSRLVCDKIDINKLSVIDYQHVRILLCKFIDESISYLKNSLTA